MKYLPLLAIALTFNTSCGLFKKTTNIFKKKQGYKITSELNVKNKLSTVETNTTLDKSKLIVNSKSRMVIYPKKGASIDISDDGVIQGEVDSIVKDITQTTDEVKDIVSNLSKKTNTSKDSIKNVKEEAKEEVKTKEVIKTPDKGSITIVYIISGIVIVIIIYIVFRRRRSPL